MRAIIFDFDGTIGDSFKVFVEVAYDITGRDQLVQPEQIERLRKLRLLDVVQEMKIPRWRWPFLLYQGRRKLAKRLHEIQVFPGMDGVLSKLKKDRYELFIMSSNSTRTIEKFLVEHGLGDYFGKVYGGVGLLGKAKALHRIMRENKLAATDAIYVGDEPRDIDAAKRVGMASVAVGWGFNVPELLSEHAPMVVVRKPEQLLNVLEEWGSLLS
jgi:phosphoglycolate phosphatase